MPIGKDKQVRRSEIFYALAISALVLGLAGCVRDRATEPPLQTVAEVDISRYAGTWHEVARLPNWFQRPGDHATTATYEPQANGTISVINSTVGSNGRRREVRGVATPVPGSGNAKLKVRFFGPFAGDYWVIGLDQKAYSWAIVGHPSRKYLWFLSRSASPSPETLDTMRRIALAQGYDLERLIVAAPDGKDR